MNEAGASPQRVVATTLFTDIVGSTDLAVRLGDRRWQALVASHHTAVRRLLSRFRGREVDTAGNGFFATFEQPTQALRAAEAIVAAVTELGVAIRVGLHAGEAEAGDEKVQGIAVHIASQVMSAARSGEILVPGTLRDLVAGSGFEFTDRGLHDLKGLLPRRMAPSGRWAGPPGRRFRPSSRSWRLTPELASPPQAVDRRVAIHELVRRS